MSQSVNELRDIVHDFKEILQVLPYFMYVLDQSGKVKYINGHLLARFGLESKDQLQDSFYDYFENKLQWITMRSKLLAQTDKEVLERGEPQYNILEPPVTDARGLNFFYEATRVPLKDENGKPSGLIVCLLDVTARRTLELQNKDTSKEIKIPRPYPPNIHRNPAKPPLILLIEDNLIAQQSARSLLVGLDCEVDVAENEAEVKELFKVGKYDFILMDIGLEGTTGYLLAKNIRQEEGKSGYCVPIIALTGFDADVVKTDCDYYFMEGAITKPLTLESARQIIQRYVYLVPIPIKGLKSLRHQE